MNNTTAHKEYTPRDYLARQAFYGSLPALDNYLKDRHGYIWDSVWYPANSVSLAEYIKWVQELDAETLDRLCDEATP